MTTPSHEEASTASVGAIIRRRRRALGMSQSDLAEVLGPPTTLADIEVLESERIVMPSWIRLLNLAKALELSVQALLGNNDAVRAEGPSRPPQQQLDLDHGDAFDHSSRQETTDESLSQ